MNCENGPTKKKFKQTNQISTRRIPHIHTQTHKTLYFGIFFTWLEEVKLTGVFISPPNLLTCCNNLLAMNFIGAYYTVYIDEHFFFFFLMPHHTKVICIYWHFNYDIVVCTFCCRFFFFVRAFHR